MGYGYYLLSEPYDYGYGVVVAVFAAQGAVDAYDGEELFAADDVDGVGFLGEQ